MNKKLKIKIIFALFLLVLLLTTNYSTIYAEHFDLGDVIGDGTVMCNDISKPLDYSGAEYTKGTTTTQYGTIESYMSDTGKYSDWPTYRDECQNQINHWAGNDYVDATWAAAYEVVSSGGASLGPQDPTMLEGLEIDGVKYKYYGWDSNYYTTFSENLIETPKNYWIAHSLTGPFPDDYYNKYSYLLGETKEYFSTETGEKVNISPHEWDEGISIRGWVPKNKLDEYLANGTIIERYSKMASYRKFNFTSCPMPHKCEYVGRWRKNRPFCT